jgi:cell division protein FtsW
MMTCVAIGLLLRVSYELDRAERQVARLRGGDLPMPEAGEGSAEPAPAAHSPAVTTSAVGPRGSRHRIEPKIGAVA